MGAIKTALLVVFGLVGIYAAVEMMSSSLDSDILETEFSPMKKLLDVTEAADKISPGVKESIDKHKEIGNKLKKCSSNLAIDSKGNVELCPEPIADESDEE